MKSGVRLRPASRQNPTDGGNLSRERVGEIESGFTRACARHFPHQVVRQVARALPPFVDRRKSLIRGARVAFCHTGNLPSAPPSSVRTGTVVAAIVSEVSIDPLKSGR